MKPDSPVRDAMPARSAATLVPMPDWTAVADPPSLEAKELVSCGDTRFMMVSTIEFAIFIASFEFFASIGFASRSSSVHRGVRISVDLLRCFANCAQTNGPDQAGRNCTSISQ
jgi:hypothetical protein